MPYVQGSEIQKYHDGSFEDRIRLLKGAVESKHGKQVNILATHAEHALVVDEDGEFHRVNYKSGKKGLTVEMAEPDLRVVIDVDLPSFVAEEIRAIVESGLNGEKPDRTRVRDLFGLVERNEQYWLGDVLDKLDEATPDSAEWMSLYESKSEASKLAGKIPTTRYTKLPEGKLHDFVEELRDSIIVLAEVFAGVVDENSGVVFDEDRNKDRSAVRKSLIAEAQAANSLLVKAEKLMSSSDAERTAQAHDKMAERAEKMAAVSELIQALNDEE